MCSTGEFEVAIVEKITRLEHPGTLRKFRWPAGLATFARYNLIYGWNGSGKTTVSRILRALELRSQVEFDVTISISGRDIDGSAFQQESIPVRVFNRDFIAESVFPVDADMAPIFVLGKDSVKKQQEVEDLKGRRIVADAKLEEAQSRKVLATQAIDQHCTSRAKMIKEILRSADSNPYNNYNKARYRRCAEEMLSTDAQQSHRLSDTEKTRLLAQHHGNRKDRIEEVAYQLPVPSHYAETVNELLTTGVVSVVIQSLKEDPELAEWVHAGLGLHKERSSNRCLFCDGTLQEDRMRGLEGHFSDEYAGLQSRLDAALTSLQAVLDEARALTLSHHSLFHEDLAEEYSATRNGLRDEVGTVGEFLCSLMEELRLKKGRAFDSYTLECLVPEVKRDTVQDLNKVVKRHNDACSEFEARLEQARRRLEKDLVEETLEDYRVLVDAEHKAEATVAEATRAVQSCIREIEGLERDIVEHRRPADELNEDLHRYLGNSELRLTVKDTGYEIMRNGSSARALSEGESTAIALLYFLKSLQDRDFDLSRGVVVLDDPVSSLDANALFLAFGYIKERTRNAAQLFILTHNFALFRNVRNWFHHLKGQRKRDSHARPARFYMLDWEFKGAQRFSALRRLDPLLERFESEYHYLFARIYREAQSTAPTALEESYVLPNMARRLLEGFLAFRQPQASGELWSKLGSFDFDEAAKTRIVRFVHTYSHSDFVGEPEHDPSSLAEARPVLKDILEFMEKEDPKHFLAMAALVSTSEADDDE